MGKSIILYSTEDLEMEICDRVYVMRDGYVTKELIGDEIDVPNIVKAAFIETEKKEDKGKKEKCVCTVFVCTVVASTYHIDSYFCRRMSASIRN